MHIRPWEHAHMTVEEIDRAIEHCHHEATAVPVAEEDDGE